MQWKLHPPQFTVTMTTPTPSLRVSSPPLHQWSRVLSGSLFSVPDGWRLLAAASDPVDWLILACIYLDR